MSINISIFETQILYFICLWLYFRPGKSDGIPIEDVEGDVAKERTRVQSEESRDTDVLRVTDLSKVKIRYLKGSKTVMKLLGMEPF